MEDELDGIALGVKDWRVVLKDFYGPLENNWRMPTRIAKKLNWRKRLVNSALSNSDVVIKMSRFGKFFACSNYPTCKYTKSFLQKTGVVCPKCGKGEVVIRFSKMKKRFYACDQYPACSFTSRWLIKAQTPQKEV